MNNYKIFFVLLALSNQTFASSIYYPEEFADFFYMTNQQVSINIAGDQDVITLLAQVNYDKFQLDPNSSSASELSQYLDSKGLKPSAIQSVLKAAQGGISKDAECSERLSNCVLSVESGELRYVYDFDRAALTIFVPPQHLKEISGEAEYESAFNHDNALVNWSRLYFSTDVEGQESITWSNESIVGLPVGALVFDTQLSNSNDEFQIYKALYDAEVDAYRIQMGRSQYALSFNTTDYLNAGASLAMDGVFLGSSSNLLKGKPEDLQRISFYAPQNGELEIYRDERLIFNKAVSEGRQSVSYSDLPQGIYDIRLELKVAGEVVLSETKLVVNNQSFSLPIGRWDYVVGGGQFLDNGHHEDYGDAPMFVRGLANYRWTESWMVGGLTTMNDKEQHFQLGTSYHFNRNIGLSYSSGIFTEGSRYQYARVNFGMLYADFRDFHHEEGEKGALATYMYGSRGYQDIGVGVSGQLWGESSGYLSYQHYIQKSKHASYETLDELSRDYISAGLSSPLLGGDLTLSSSYTIESDHDNESRVDLTWTWRFGENWSTQVRLTTDEDGFDSSTNYLRVNQKWDNWAANGSVGATVSSTQNGGYETGSDISATLNGHSRVFNADAYAYANDSGEQRISGSLSGTQIVSRGGVDLTYEKASSFVKVSTSTASTDDTSDTPQWPMQYTLSRDGEYLNRGELVDDKTLIKLSDYSQIGVHIETGGQNVAIEGDTLNGFVHPGSLYELKTNVIPLKSRVVVLDDIFGEPITQVQCVGNGCVSVEPLSDDGVFRINYEFGKPYQLVSRKGLCITETMSSTYYENGVCMPGLEDREGSPSWEEAVPLLDNATHQPVLIYLGRFDKGKDLSLVTNKLDALGLKYKTVTIDGIAYLYLMRNDSFNSQQRAFLKALDAYVLLQDSTFDLITLTSQWSETHEAL
ncbi:hypothetical protein PO80_02510 [Vibrio parahaemolyticus]|uniref:TcfC E-set like domain-containing protein n=1 Tax=Vibrio parahaemolyticus TaxID=670 RepID=UPI000542308A|nr:TcfC E-set like domain-containing protein [Vibrio parahaemolyticus]ELU8562254.1 TcfC E-set like domain-containing protein [Vibrio parahaemolyticus]KHF17368.1 hypothetical protein PO80_02510 [Vibrio parahaemolyticus]OTV96539.1 hypothetical protein BA739_23180 [Vibrio parahaemolyticus]OTW00270.1 hypothetical protein BA740_23855 [Vibrio parahaemolyticus]